MCVSQRRLGCPDSWWGEAETAGTHSKPDEHPSAGGGWLLAAGPAIINRHMKQYKLGFMEMNNRVAFL